MMIIYLRIRAIVNAILNRWDYCNLISTIWFNFKYLPFRQAIYLPIFLHKNNTSKFRGKIQILSIVEPGMIELGVHEVGIYADTGIYLEGTGSIIFEGGCKIKSGSYLCIGEKGVLKIGKNVEATYGLKVVCWKSINVGDNVLIGWECKLIDTDFHTLISLDGRYESTQEKPIVIGDNCWLAQNCTVLKGVELPAYTVVASNSLLNKKYTIPTYCLLAGTPAWIVREGILLKRQ